RTPPHHPPDIIANPRGAATRSG
ncbi:hypothetical protein AZ019_002506, partial [Klebsiella pneumoniae]